MRSTWVHTIRFATVLFLAGMAGNRLAKAVPWDIFEDPASSSACDTVNAANFELVVLSDTGELKVITDVDEFLPDTLVDADGSVFFNGFPMGVIEFAEDGDGYRTLWWLADDGTVVAVDESTGVPYTTIHFPTDFLDVPCDACELWDNPADCDEDEDLDGVPDEFDFCPGTPLDEVADADGCSCIDFDDDDDGINNCFDDCPSTPFDAEVDEFGCETGIIVQPPPVTVVQPTPFTIICGNFSTLTMALTFGTLVTLRLARRRIRETVTGHDRRNGIA